MCAKFKKNKKSKGNRHRQDDPVRAKKFLGQHFLKDEGIAQDIADALTLEGYNHVLEIGPGTGVLTKYLIKKPVEVLALDLDRESVHYLETDFMLKHIADTSKLRIQNGDFLKMDVNSYFDGQSFAVIGNFPYNISSQIVFKVLENKELVPEFAGMFQKEVAERICAAPGNKTYGILSVFAQAYYETEYLFTVPPHVFNPPPKVDSGVIRLKRKSNITLNCDEELFYKVVKTAFNQRRKTLRNSLKTFGLSDNLKENAIFDRRPEELAVADFAELTDKISNDTV